MSFLHSILWMFQNLLNYIYKIHCFFIIGLFDIRNDWIYVIVLIMLINLEVCFKYVNIMFTIYMDILKQGLLRVD